MKKSAFGGIIGVSLFSVLVLPLYIIFFLSPAFTGFIKQSTEYEAVRVARYLASVFVPDGRVISKHHLPLDFNDRVAQVRDQFLLKKVKMFSANGEIIYSTDPADIGKMNKHDYFHTIVASGQNFTKLVKKDTATLEGKIMHAHVVETYIPFMQRGNFVGAFEIYYDVTARKEKLDSMLLGLYIALGIIVTVLLFSVGLGIRGAIGSMKKQERMASRNAELEEAILAREDYCAEKVKEAVKKVKRPQGLVSICRSCSRVRANDGEWQEIKKFMEENSEITCSHDLCPYCENTA